MAVILETSLGDLTVDLYTEERPRCCLNFLKLCKIKYYNFCLFHSVQRNLVAQTGDPTGTGKGGESMFAKLYGDQAAFFEQELKPRIKHTKFGTLSMVNNGSNLHGSQFFITTGSNLDYLDNVHTVFGEVSEGFDVLEKINEAIADEKNRPFQDIRIFHTVVLDDPYDDPQGLGEHIPDRSPEPTKEQLESGRIGVDEVIDDKEGKSLDEIEEMHKSREAKANAQILEMVGDLPDAEVRPPDTVLFVCKLNPVTTDSDLEIIFSRFGTIKSCEVIRDKKTEESLQYAFIEFTTEEECENAYFKMDNVIIDDHRIHVDFSQSVSKYKWKGKGKGVETKEDRPSYIIKDKSRRDDGYNLVFSDDNDDEMTKGTDNKKKHKKKKKKHKKHKHHRDDESSDSEKSPSKHKRMEISRHSTPPAKHPNDSRRDRSRSPGMDRQGQDRDKDRRRDREDGDRDRSKYYSKERDRDRDRGRYRDRKRDT